MSIRCFTGARLHEQAPDAKPVAPALADRPPSGKRPLSAQRCQTCPGWTCNNGLVCTRCLLAVRGRA